MPKKLNPEQCGEELADFIAAKWEWVRKFPGGYEAMRMLGILSGENQFDPNLKAALELSWACAFWRAKALGTPIDVSLVDYV